MRTSMVIDMAANHPDYLVKVNYLCPVISGMYEANMCTYEEMLAAKESVHESICGAMFLKTYLCIRAGLSKTEDFKGPVYKEAAAKHWHALIKYLQVQEKAENVYKRHAPLHEIACDSWARGFNKAQAYREASNAGYAYCVAVKEISIIWDRMDKGLAELEAKCTARPEDFVGTWK